MSEQRLSGDELRALENMYRNPKTLEARTIRLLLDEINLARNDRNKFRDALGRELTKLEKRARINGE